MLCAAVSEARIPRLQSWEVQALNKTIGASKTGKYITSGQTVNDNLLVLDSQIDNHTKELGEHTQTLENHTQTLDEHAQQLGVHTQTLDDHTQKLGEHVKIFVEHKQAIDKQAQIQSIYKGKIGLINTTIGTTEDGTYISSTSTIGKNINVLDERAKINAGMIEKNTVNIQQNRQQITLNTKNITKNTQDIEGHSVRLDKHEFQITRNRENIQTLNSELEVLSENVTGLNSRVDRLNGRVDKVGAGAAALAALHPLDYDPEAKWDVAAGLGNYRGKKALAFGTFFRPNENIMISLGATIGNGENMANLGVSFKLGGTKTTRSRTILASEIVDLRTQVAALSAKINSLSK